MNDNAIDFASLTASAKYLNKQSDSFHSTLVNIQHKIIKLGVGLEVWNNDPKSFVPDGVQRYGNTTYGWILGLTKHDGAWCIAVRGAHFFNPDKTEPSFLDDEPIEL